ncbi:phage replisome organizer N-terminal domain-containing protein [Peptostreptococcus sp. D1]|uniref:phage replisome organizer N-terminal domain-containing protein n=1 Tax=Peptostreptococcus sp. D1 TaxID=72304 RepID=UPI000B860E0A|nr:phage replisome organizer N-terminal domain-containing protein [Peptostreptococcus sp. D1]
MSDNKKYYYLKLKENFFESDEIIYLESLPDGYKYSNILLKLYLRSLKNTGKLMMNDAIPYSPEILATVTRHSVGDIKQALVHFSKLGLVEMLENGTIFMLQIQNFIGKSSSEGDRKREYRKKIDETKKIGQMSRQLPENKNKEDGQMSRQLPENKNKEDGQMSRQLPENENKEDGQMSRQISEVKNEKNDKNELNQGVGQMSDNRPPELELEIEIDIDKDIDNKLINYNQSNKYISDSDFKNKKYLEELERCEFILKHYGVDEKSKNKIVGILKSKKLGFVYLRDKIKLTFQRGRTVDKNIGFLVEAVRNDWKE